MKGVAAGNAKQDGKNHKSWFVGRFIGEPLRRTEDVEVKWAFHPAGDSKGRLTANAGAATITILLRGRFRFTFARDGASQEVLLENEGDYALWHPGVRHDYLAETDSVLLSVRWPSLAEDQDA
jgi:quercetin dioxygenase-like cupin family protein